MTLYFMRYNLTHFLMKSNIFVGLFGNSGLSVGEPLKQGRKIDKGREKTAAHPRDGQLSDG